MARQADAIDMPAASQFFIDLADNPSLDYVSPEPDPNGNLKVSPDKYGYCVFGEVTDGKEIVDKIASGEVHKTAEIDSAGASRGDRIGPPREVTVRFSYGQPPFNSAALRPFAPVSIRPIAAGEL